MHGARRGANSNNRQSWEQSEFPILCETCLGDNPYVRMTKNEFGSECKVCARPFTVFRWKPGTQARYKKTEICQTCAKLKNVCQTCILDLRYGLPVQVRDTAEPHHVDIPISDVNREYYAQINEQKLLQNGTNSSVGLLTGGKMTTQHSETLLRLQRSEPYYKRNRAHICSFFVKGTCTRGSECPYRHEMPETGELADQNLKDRFFGVNDPVAKKMLNRVGASSTLKPPEDKTVTTLYVGGVKEHISENDLREVFAAFGELQNIRMVPRATCAFVTYISRLQAEKAAENLSGKLVIRDTRLNLQWGKPLAGVHGKESAETYPFSVPLYPTAPPHFFAMPTGAIAQSPAYQGAATAYLPAPVIDPTNAPARIYYPSMDPQRRGSAHDKHGSEPDKSA